MRTGKALKFLNRFELYVYLHDETTSYTTIYLQIQFQQESAQFLTPHPMNTKGEGKPTATLPLLVFSDETSGNTTKNGTVLKRFP